MHLLALWLFLWVCEREKGRRAVFYLLLILWQSLGQSVLSSDFACVCVCVLTFILENKKRTASFAHAHTLMQHCQPWQFTGHGDWQAFTVFRHLEPALCLALSSVMDCMLNRVYAFLFFSLGFSPKPPPHFPLFSFFLSLFLNTGGCRLDWFLVDRWWMCVRSGNGPVSYAILFVCVCATLTTECGLKVKLYFNTALTLWVKILQVCYTVKKTCHEVLV